MRIAFIDSEPPSASGGGIRTYTRLMAGQCRRRGFEIRIYSHNPEAYAGMDARGIQRAPFLPRGLRALAYRFFHAETMAFEHSRWLADELEKETFDLVEIPDFQGYGFFPLRDPKLRRRAVLRVHTPLHLAYREEGRTGSSFQVLRYRENWCLGNARHTSAPSAEFLAEKLPWVRPQNTLPNPPPTQNSASALANGKNGPVSRFLFLGRLEPRKGARELLKAFLGLAREYPSIKLDFVAGGIESDFGKSLLGITRIAPESIQTRIRWLPPHAGDKMELFQAYDCLVVPSRWENCPYVFWEGMSAGIPCLGTETGEMKRARRMTRAPLIPPGDVRSLAAALRHLIQNPRERLLERQDAYLKSVAEETSSLTDWYLQCIRYNG